MTSRTRFEPASHHRRRLRLRLRRRRRRRHHLPTPSPRRCSTAARETSHAVGRDGHRPLVDGCRYPRETSPL